MLVKIRDERKDVLYTSHNMEEGEIYRVIFIQKVKDFGTPKELIAKYGRKDLNVCFLPSRENMVWIMKPNI